MRIGILATGITPDDLIDQYGTYADMFIDLLNDANASFEFEVFNILHDDFPDSVNQCDGWLITGSKHNVYQNLPWMQKLKEFILDISHLGKPIVGICFGHQIIAEAFGGIVEKYHGGWGVGLQTYQLVDADDVINDNVSSFTINAVHQDQVTTKPKNARTFASSAFCEHAGLVYRDDRIITFQSHPEFDVTYEKALVEYLRGQSITDEMSDAALTELNQPGAATDSPKVARWMADFLQSNNR